MPLSYASRMYGYAAIFNQERIIIAILLQNESLLYLQNIYVHVSITRTAWTLLLVTATTLSAVYN